MSNDLTMRVKIVGQTSEYEGKVTQTTNKQRTLNNELYRSSTAAGAVNRNFSQMAVTNNRAAKSIQHMSHMAVGMLSTFQAIAVAKIFKDRLAEIQDMEVRMQSLSVTAEAYAENQAYLKQLAFDHSKELLTLTDSYSKLLALQKSGLITQKEGRQILEGMSNAASSLGADSTQLKLSLFGMAQGFSAGTLRAEELNQVTDPLPGLLQELDKAAGLSAGGFRKMVVDGKVTSQFFKTTLIKALSAYEGAAEKTFDNISAKQNRNKNQFDELVKAYSKPIDGTFSASVDVLNTTMAVFTNNADTVIGLMQAGLVVALGHGTKAVVSFTSAKVKSTIADKAQRQATISALETEIKRATALKASALASSQSIAAEQRLTAARNQLAIATNKVSLASRGISLLSAVVGGLPGLLTIAAIGMYSFASSAEAASAKSFTLTDNLKALEASYKSLTEIKLKSKLIDLNEAIAEQTKQLNKQKSIVAQAKNESAQYYDAELKRWIELPAATEAGSRRVIKALEREEQQTEVLNQQLELQKRIKLQLANLANGGKPEQPNKPAINPVIEPPKPINNDLQRVITSLHTEEDAIRASYVKRHSIIEKALANKQITEQRYFELSMQLEGQRDADLQALEQEKIAEKAQRANDIRQRQEQILQDQRESEIARAQGYHSRVEAEEAAHQERLFAARTEKTGALQANIVQFANWQKKTELEKTSAVIGLGEQAFAAMGQQSKKAFAAYKAFAISQALIKTYESATSAYAALAPIPVVGPALGVAAAGVAVAMGIANVNAIRSQQPAGFEKGGRIGGSQSIVEIGERNKPEVLEFEGKNYLLGGNGGAVFNRSQLQQTNGSTKAKAETSITIKLIEDANKSGQSYQEKSLSGEDVISIFVSNIREGGEASSSLEASYGLKRVGR